MVAVLSGISTLVPWRKSGEEFSKAYEMISDGIMQYDAVPEFPIENVLIAAREAGQVIPTSREWDQIAPANNVRPVNAPVRSSDKATQPRADGKIDPP